MAGIAIYGESRRKAKLTLQSGQPDRDFADLGTDLAEAGVGAFVTVKNTHAVVDTDVDVGTVRDWLAARRSEIRVMSFGESVEIYKEVGLPKEVVARFAVRSMSGRHGIGHTRMATESAVTTLGASPVFHWS